MLGRLNNLNRRIVADLGKEVEGQGHVRDTDGAVVKVVGRTDDLEDRHHGMGHVFGLGAVAQVDVDERERVSGEPSGLESDRATTRDRPLRPVLCGRDSTTYEKEKSD